MSKLKFLAALAAVTMGGAALAVSAPAYAETPSCGSSCVDLFNLGPDSTPGNPSYLLDSFKQGQKTGTGVILFAVSNTDPAQDFTAQSPEPLADYLQAGLVGVQVALHYGCEAGVDFSQCTGSGGQGVNDYAFELEYSPFGAPTGECAGVASAATAGEGVTLQPCGVSGKTIWIWDAQACFSQTTTNGGVVTGGTPSAGCREMFASWQDFVAADNFPLINGSDTNFSQPFVLTYPSGQSPLQTPRPQVGVQNLTTFSNSEGYPNGDVSDYQLWGARFGEVQP